MLNFTFLGVWLRDNCRLKRHREPLTGLASQSKTPGLHRPGRMAGHPGFRQTRLLLAYGVKRKLKSWPAGHSCA
jgi:hypothetical protein